MIVNPFETGADEFLVPLPPELDTALAMPLDEACDIALAKLGLPLLGGPSGRGWSYYGVAMKCAHLFNVVHEEGTGKEKRKPAHYLQIGGLYHLLQALYYGHGLDAAVWDRRGLIRADLWPGRKRKTLTVPPTAADALLDELKAMCGTLEADLRASVDTSKAQPPRPSEAFILEAERCFDFHTNYWGQGQEDIEPLAVEWWAEHPTLKYTCRYDMIGRIGRHDPRPQLKPGDIVGVERKSAAWLSEVAREGWRLEGEILGQALNWRASGCEKIFGPLKAIIVDIVTKEAKTQRCHQVILAPETLAHDNFARWINYTNAQIGLWRATNAYPQFFTGCWDRFGKCANWEACARGGK